MANFALVCLSWGADNFNSNNIIWSGMAVFLFYCSVWFWLVFIRVFFVSLSSFLLWRMNEYTRYCSTYLFDKYKYISKHYYISAYHQTLCGCSVRLSCLEYIRVAVCVKSEVWLCAQCLSCFFPSRHFFRYDFLCETYVCGNTRYDTIQHDC